MKNRGDSYKDIFGYWWPELISQALLLALPFLLDALIVAQLRSTTTYGALGIANNFLHILTKSAESFQVAAIAVVGKFNGAKNYRQAGNALGNVFWTSLITGSIFASIIFFFSTEIYLWLNVPHRMAVIGAPFLKLRGIVVLLMFIYLALIGFMKGVKNTRTPMMIFIAGQVIFILFDYLLVLGKCGFPQLRLQGSAIASFLQYSIMIILSIAYILFNPHYKKFFPRVFFSLFNKQGALQILNMSWQIAIDKISLSFAYVQLSKMIAPMGKYVIASFSVIKDLERFAFLPAIAFASILTFLVSNRLGAQDPQGARTNVKKILIVSGALVGILLVIICFDPARFIGVFDPKQKFTLFAARIFPIISMLVVFDFVQVTLAAALRGAGDVSAVMLIRVFTCFGIFYPVGWFLASLPIDNITLKFALLYGFFYVNNGIMGGLFLLRMKFKKWNSSLASPTNKYKVTK